jgi:hypothetical protein
MEQVRVAALLEKYWQAETTVEEERQLADYFRQPVIPPEWEPWRNVFAYFEAEAQITPDKDFENKLMERIRQLEAAAAPVRSLFRSAPWWVAAAVIILAVGVSRLTGFRRATGPESGSLAPSAVIKDTYDDPQQALAAIQRALRTASAKMNHGKTIAQKQMDRMNDGLQSAITN